MSWERHSCGQLETMRLPFMTGEIAGTAELTIHESKDSVVHVCPVETLRAGCHFPLCGLASARGG
jgi:hypothetical protein